MRIVKPAKIPVLSRVLERAHRPELHVACVLGFPLDAPRNLLDELGFWPAVSAALGASSFDDGFAKAHGEMLVAGSFCAPGGVPLAASYVRAKVGAVDKQLAVVGDRVFRDHQATEPTPMATMQIDWPHALGGPSCAFNPYGKGIGPGLGGDIPFPNVEPFGRVSPFPSHHREPAGLLPMDMTFHQRRARAGTFAAGWLEAESPGLPRDADPACFNTALKDQWVDGFFGGDEEVLIVNMHPERPRIASRLPGLAARCFVTQRTAEGQRFVEVPLRFDTVWLFPAAPAGPLAVLIARGVQPVREDDAADIVDLVCACEEQGAPRPIEHYQAVLARRLDRDKGALASLSDADLMPPPGSGVTPDFGENPMLAWVADEGHLAANQHRGRERSRRQRAAVVANAGLDPAEYGLAEALPPPERPPLGDLGALAGYIDRETARAAREGARAEAMTTDRAAETCARLGVDYDALTTGAEGMGPPTSSVARQLALLERGGIDAEPYQADLLAGEAGLLEMYRRHGHRQRTAKAMDADTAARVRLRVELAMQTGTSLAGADLTGASLAGMDLRGIDFTHALLEAADLSGSDLTGASLLGAMLAKANLRGAKLTAARMRGANLGGAVLRDADLEDADLTDAVIGEAEVVGARFVRAKLTGADWTDAKLTGADLTDAVLGPCTLIRVDLRGVKLAGVDLGGATPAERGATLIECALFDADLRRANLVRVTFCGCTADGASLREANLRQAVFAHGCSFGRADLRGAQMERANLRGTGLVGARFDDAQLAGADLSEADAAGANFDRALLVGAMMIRTDFTGANLRGANLRDALASKARFAGADLSGANLYGADFSRVTADADTTWAGAETGHLRLDPKADAPDGATT